MKWLDLMWWVFIRGVASGAIEGALVGTLLVPIAGTLIGLFFGLLIGAALGVVNSLSLPVLTRVFFYGRGSRSRLIFCVMLLAIPIDLFIVLSLFGNQLGNTTAVLMAITAAYFSFGYVDFVGQQFELAQATASPEQKKGVIVELKMNTFSMRIR